MDKKKLLIHLVLVVGSLVMIAPFVWMFMTSFKTLYESMQIPPSLFPESFGLENYRKVFVALPFIRLYGNTFAMIGIRLLTSSLFCAMAAYGFARLVFPGRSVLFAFVLMQLMVPAQIFIIPQYQLVASLGLLNTVFALAIPGLVSAYGTFLLRQFAMGIPKELEEAAVIDGANKWHIFVRIMLPLMKTGIVSLGIFTALFAWKDLMWPLIVNTNISTMTLSAGLANLMGQFVADYPVFMAGSVMAIVPMVILFILFQKQFIQGIALTGGK